MFVRISANGEVLDAQTFPGEEGCSLVVVEKNKAYFVFVQGEKIVGAIPVACGDSNHFAVPRVLIEETGIRVVFLNVNGRPVQTEFAMLLLLGDQKNVDLPTVKEMFDKLGGAGMGTRATTVGHF